MDFDIPLKGGYSSKDIIVLSYDDKTISESEYTKIPIILVNKEPEKRSTDKPFLTPEAFEKEFKLREENIVGVNGEFVRAILLHPGSNIDFITKHVFTSEDFPLQANDKILPEQAIFLIMFHHLHFLETIEIHSDHFANDFKTKYEEILRILPDASTEPFNTTNAEDLNKYVLDIQKDFKSSALKDWNSIFDYLKESAKKLLDLFQKQTEIKVLASNNSGPNNSTKATNDSTSTGPTGSNNSTSTGPTGSNNSTSTGPTGSNNSTSTGPTGSNDSTSTGPTGSNNSTSTGPTGSNNSNSTDPTGSNDSTSTGPTGSNDSTSTGPTGSNNSTSTGPTGSNNSTSTGPTGSNDSTSTGITTSTGPTGSNELDYLNTLEKLNTHIGKTYQLKTEAETKDTGKKSLEKFKTEDNDYYIMESSGNENDCLIHTFLTSTCENFRKLEKKDKNHAANFFRRTIFPLILEKTDTKENEKARDIKRAKGNGLLEDIDINYISKFYKFNYVMFEDEKVEAVERISPNKTRVSVNERMPRCVLYFDNGGNCYMFYNNNKHFESVKKGKIYIIPSLTGKKLQADNICEFSTATNVGCIYNQGDKVMYKGNPHWVVWRRKNTETDECAKYGLTGTEEKLVEFLMLSPELQQKTETLGKYGKIEAMPSELYEVKETRKTRKRRGSKKVSL